MARPPSDAEDGPEHRSRATNGEQCCARVCSPAEQDLDQDDGEKDRERIVDAGFDLERGADARPQPQPPGVEQEEHRRRVGRGHHGADQQRLGPVDAAHDTGDRRGQRRRDQDTQRWRAGLRARARCGRSRSRVRSPPSNRIRASATSHHIGQPHVVELDAAAAGFAGQHAGSGGHQGSNGAPKRNATRLRHDAGQHQHGAEQDGDANQIKEEVHRAFTTSRRGPRPRTMPCARARAQH